MHDEASTLNFQMKEADSESLKASHSPSWKWFWGKKKNGEKKEGLIINV